MRNGQYLTLGVVGNLMKWLLVLCILVITWLGWVYYRDKPIPSAFAPVMSERERAGMMDILEVLVTTMHRINVSYFMIKGTLLGSYRHHGFIPWDIDVDLFVNASESAPLREELSKLEPDYMLAADGGDFDGASIWRIYAASGRYVPFHDALYPDVDLFLYEDQGREICRRGHHHDPEWCFERAEVLPLTRRPFEPNRLPPLLAPHNVTHVLLRQGIDLTRGECITETPDLKPEGGTFQKRFVVPCTRLQHLYPFVYRVEGDRGQLAVEYLMQGSRILSIYKPGVPP